jgi:hypothetical protein
LLPLALLAPFNVLWGAIEPVGPAGQPPDAGQVAFFEKNIRPVLVDKCYKCHSSESTKVKGGLLLDTRESIRAGGDTGPAVVPGDVKASLLMKALRWEDKDLKMPPEKDGGKLPEAVIANFEKWIAMGAPDPRDRGGNVVRKSMDIEKAKQEQWTYQKPKAAPAPAVKDTAWPRTEVDRFLLAAQEAKGLHPGGDADRRTLLRRVYFDLVGLPPTPAQIEAFVQDKSPNALAKVVDALLASPQFGERWGRHWLDTARFAESTGKERNFTFPEAWRYRDWVIGAVNADKPYNQFIIEQIAGDLLPAKDSAERDAHIVATGFLAVGPKGLNERNKEVFRMEIVDDQIDTTTRAVLGLTVACARCHDHKFDPVPTKDYYALAGIFRSTNTYFGTEGMKQNRNGTSLVALTPPPASAGAVAPATGNSPAPVTAAPAAPVPVSAQTAPTAAAATTKPEIPAAIAGDTKKARRFANLPPEKRAALLARFGNGVPPSAIDNAKKNAPDATAGNGNAASAAAPEKSGPTLPPALANNPAIAERFANLPNAQKRRLLEKLAKNPNTKFGQGKGQTGQGAPAGATAPNSSKGPQAMGVADGSVSNAAILIRGEVDSRGDVAPRGFVSVLSNGPAPALPPNASGRLELAQWLTSTENPLTARVMVNRVWQHLFGEGLVRTADNFGATGEAPSNAALLDTLAVQFMRDGWSLKKLVRSLVLSRSYQLSSAPNAKGMEVDPDNRLVWRATPRRLEAEVIRDAMLAASGTIDLKPLHGSVVANVGDGYIGRGLRPESFTDVKANYRSVYLPVVRDFVPEAMDIFDFAEPSLVVATRDVTNVPGQALYLLNNDFVREQATAMAKRVMETPNLTAPQRIALAYQMALSRPPTETERARAEAYLAEAASDLQPGGQRADTNEGAVKSWSTFCQALFACAEFRYLK